MIGNFPVWWNKICQSPSNDGMAADTDSNGLLTRWGFIYSTWVDARLHAGYDDTSMQNYMAQSQADMSALAKSFFWDRQDGDALPVGADIMVIDFTFGSGGAAMCIQRNLNAAGASLRVDGAIGPGTVAAIAKYGPSFLADCYGWRIGYYDRFGFRATEPGLYRRAAECLDLGKALIAQANINSATSGIA